MLSCKRLSADTVASLNIVQNISKASYQQAYEQQYITNSAVGQVLLTILLIIGAN